jgi:hypothetical protein
MNNPEFVLPARWALIGRDSAYFLPGCRAVITTLMTSPLFEARRGTLPCETFCGVPA